VKFEKVDEDNIKTGPLDGLTPGVRRGELLRFVEERRTAKVEELAELFRVSAMTVHRDLDAMAHEGLLERIRGGARALPRRFTERDVRLRRGTRAEQKQVLAAVAATLVRPGDIVALDDSTTVGAMFAHLAGRHPSALITHSLGLMSQVTRELPEITLVGLGGQYYPQTDSFLGSVVVDQINRVSADIVFVSTTAVKNNALFHPDAEAALTKRALIGMGDRKVLLLDVTKFQVNGLYHVVDLAVFDDIVVEADLPTEHRDALDRRDVTVHYVPMPQP
jgi:DeoR/GlpR family transcriptional regulator of sugar metabolism